MLESLREQVWRLHLELPRNHLVTWTSGNLSARHPETNLVVIKPSGLHYEDLRPENMVIVDLDGNVVEGDLKPSSDTASHLYIYRHRPQVNGIVHTHSRYATAFAANNMPIPVYLTAIADEFGGTIPCGGFALIGSEAIGKAVLEAIGAIPHYNLSGFRLPIRYQEVTHIVSESLVLGIANFGVAYLSSNIAQRLHEGERRLYQANASCELRAAELSELNRRLQQLDQDRSLFMRLVTHELRAPVAAIQSYLRLILEGYVPAERVHEIVAKSETVPSGWKVGLLLALTSTPSRRTERPGRQAPEASSRASRKQTGPSNLTR